MALDQIPSVYTFLGVADLTTGTLIIASLGIAHPLVYGCTLCQSLSYLVMTMWLLVVGYCAVIFDGVLLQAHPLVYGCTLCQSLSYLVMTMWLLVVGYCAVSIVLMVGIFQSSTILVTVWIWYTLVFIVLMVVLMILMTFAAASRDQSSRAFCAIVAIVWYLFTIYFVFVVNSYRKMMIY